MPLESSKIFSFTIAFSGISGIVISASCLKTPVTSLFTLTHSKRFAHGFYRPILPDSTLFDCQDQGLQLRKFENLLPPQFISDHYFDRASNAIDPHQNQVLLF